ncbi:helix-turn-helix transcriptional regulator [Frankia sp. CNm7]|uniref:Helix-turn-helix transcriptional regulator n=1 Tax=Frankia nepalensis TaxID=1836974 RepID=A0A937UNS6_9ACTN|nr:helix-turn-helix transcriptional regulator [Frankia nepalensis]MBL7502347.1 helix-turn-helix transcriptional regulator [Frankia nepalensis]MBL7516066.1 helix-turn-helix transcriptional regulator [Frankia nepalensis]MBL7519907.1 helix-turn-helix transcriptional regulator [Frankia nepalensis]MBL7626550.1 helix-turn-helix transcriptional regulator [Frankia nepalensis]
MPAPLGTGARPGVTQARHVLAGGHSTLARNGSESIATPVARHPARVSARPAAPEAGAAGPGAPKPGPAEQEPTAPAPTRTPNGRLRLCREEKGWSQERLAVELRRFAVLHEGREAGVTGNMICKWEKGDKKPSLRYQRLLRALFHRSSAELGFIDDDPAINLAPPGLTAPILGIADVVDPQAGNTMATSSAGTNVASNAPIVLRAADEADLRGIPVERRGFLRMMAAGGVAVVPVGAAAALTTAAASDEAPWDRLSAALRHRSPVTPELAQQLSQQTAGLFGLEERVPARTLMARVTGHLCTLTQLLEATTRSPIRRELASTAGETAALAGWLAFDLRDNASALAYYRVAIEAAREAEDPALWACVLGYESYQPSGAGRHDQAVALLAEAQRRLGRAGNPLTRAWLAAREAEEQAARGDGRAAVTALDRAQEAFGAAGPTDRVWTGFFDRGRLDGLRVTTFTRLRRPAAAYAAASDALAAAGPAATKKRSLLLGDVAEVHIQRRDVDAAARFAADALAIVAQTDFSLGLARVQRVRERLAPWQSTQPVRDLDEQLRALLV